MSRKLSLIFFLALFSLSSYSGAQIPNWSGIISPKRAVNWANAGVPGGVPTNYTQCGPTLAAYTGTAATINAALAGTGSGYAGCGTPYFIQLGAGTFHLSTTIDLAKSNVMLVGSGANSTLLIFSATGGGNCQATGICIESGMNSFPGAQYNTNYADWTAGYAQGATSITLNNTSAAPASGQMIILDQCDDGLTGSGSGSNYAGGCTGTPTDSGNIWVCGGAAGGAAEGICMSANIAGGAGRVGRSQQQQVLVTGVISCGTNCSTVTISPGLYMPNWRAGQSPGAFWASSSSPGTGEGVENLSIDMGAASGDPSGVYVLLCHGCWITGNRIVNTGRDHIWIYESSHTTVANNYMYGTQNASDESYGVESFIGSDNLIVNNIGDTIVSSEIVNGADVGNVYAYNFSVNDYYTQSQGWFMASNWLHAAGSGMDLWEGNQGPGFIADNRHGSHNFSTLYRNFSPGNQIACFLEACNQQTAGIMTHFSRYFNFIGNVLGSSGYSNNYSTYPSSTTSSGSSSGAQTSIYAEGFSGNFNAYDSANGKNDMLTAPSQLIWGNYDVVTGAVRWCGDSSDTGWSTICSSTSEVPANFSDTTGSPSLYVNAVPTIGDTGAGQGALPASFYYNSQPSWWATSYGTPPWPAIGPDVSGGNVPGSAEYANNIPAALVWMNAPVDPYYQVSYAITGGSWSSGTETITFASGTWNSSTSCSLTSIQICSPQGEIRISGANPSAINGTYQITGASANSVSFALASNPGSVSSGTMKWPNVRLFTATAYSSDLPPVPPGGLTAVVH